MTAQPITIVETAEFQKHAAALFGAEDVEAIKTFIAYNPTAGVVMRGTGGVRKLRWAASGRGKRGGARVIYYHHSEDMPIFLFTVYAKAARTDLPPGQRSVLKRIVADIVATYGKGGAS